MVQIVLTVFGIFSTVVVAYFLSVRQIAKKNPKLPVEKDEIWQLSRATNQNNQLRIALITISLGIFIRVDEYPFQTAKSLTIIFSVLAAVAGLVAWKASSSYFYNEAYNNKTKEKHANIICKTGDKCLVVFVALAGGLITYLEVFS